MEPVSIRPIDKPIRISFDGSQVSLPTEYSQRVNDYLSELNRNEPGFRNGEVFTVTDVQETAEATNIQLAETNYAHYLYCLRVGSLGRHTVRIIHPAALVTTSDNHLIFGSMGRQTSIPGTIQCCGGGIDRSDIQAETVNLRHNMERELREELGIDPSHNETIKSFSPTYLKYGGPTGKMTVVYTLQTSQDSKSFLQDYQTFAQRLKDAGEEPEFSHLYRLPATHQAVDEFITTYRNRLDEYMPVLLRQVVTYP